MEAFWFPCQKKIKKTAGPVKVKTTVFWDMHGVVLVDFTPRGSTTSAGHYQSTMTGLNDAGLLSHRVLLLHDTARPHIARTTVNLLNTWHWEILSLPPCSPDLAPPDFHLFTELKMNLPGLRLQTDKSLQRGDQAMATSAGRIILPPSFRLLGLSL
jgi:hypothetical protein